MSDEHEAPSVKVNTTIQTTRRHRLVITKRMLIGALNNQFTLGLSNMAELVVEDIKDWMEGEVEIDKDNPLVLKWVHNETTEE